MGNLEEELKDFLHHSATVNQLMLSYFQEQLKEQNRTPENSPPRVYNLWNVVLPSPTALQIVPGNPARYKVGIANSGPSNILYSTNWFDPISVLRNFSDPLDPDTVTPGYNQAIEMGFLLAGMAVEVNSIRSIWAYSLGSQAGSNQNAILSIQDSLYKVSHDSFGEPNGNGLHQMRDLDRATHNVPDTSGETAQVYK
jgi:hypothetical protein